MSTCLGRALVDRHFSGTIVPAEEQRLRAHLPGCSECRAHYESWLLLAQIDPSVPDAQQRIGRGLGFGHSAKRRATSYIAAAAIAAGAILGVRFLPRSSESDEGFASRGADATSINAPELIVYRTTSRGAAPMLATTTLGRNDELSFAYTNPAGKRFAMIFGLDANRHVYWYYPAWTDSTENPTSIPILAGGNSHDLPDAVRQDLKGSSLTIHAVLSDVPLSVREVEARFASEPASTFHPHIVVTRTFELSP
jgi:hypothetical protein